MQSIEIGYIKKLLLPLLVIATIIVLGATVYIFFSDKFQNNITAKIINVAGIILFGYTLSGSWRRVLSKKPVLVFTDQELKIYNNRNPVCFRWNEITCWKVEEVKDNEGYRLLVESDMRKENISLNWLEKSPREIEQLMISYTSLKN